MNQEQEIKALQSVLELTKTPGDVITFENTHWAFADLMGWDTIEEIKANNEKILFNEIYNKLNKVL